MEFDLSVAERNLYLTLGDETLPVESGGAFVAHVAGRFGINVVSLTATDAASNTTRTTFQRSLHKARKRR